ncbi:hypothetical protein ScPMuIL_015721 [Solemya velum]
MVSRLRLQYCKVIIATSLVWFLLDVILLMYYTDCTSLTSGSDCNNGRAEGRRAGGDIDLKPEGILQKIIPKGLLNRIPESPGDNGKAVVVPSARHDEYKEKFKINQFNLVASDMMSLNRTLPDYRLEACKNKMYPTELPTTSVVIVFHNEAWSTLLRTVHSIINRSPRELLEEIILVDDASDRDELKKKLDEYVAKLPVRTFALRSEKREGLIRARLRGAEVAKGDVLTFLDAHCECTIGWLEPLLTEVKKNRKTVACPIIDVISDESFEYITGSDMTWGGFNWKLNFRWYPVPQRELTRRGGDRSQPTKTPTMAGGLFSIEKDYFYEIGSYDEGMDIWGAENLEMSFRIWMCGGQIHIVTCSRVGHVFRKTSPYSWPGGVARIINHNTQRIVEVWLDEYKDFFYKINPGVRSTEYGDVSERAKLRKNLQCKSFRWYLEHIYPESQLPLDYFSLGEVKNSDSGKCIDTMGRKSGEKIGMVHCHGLGGNQVFSYTKKQALQTDDLCLDVSAIAGPAKLFQCHGLGGNQKWEYDKETKELKHINSKQCLGKPSLEESDTPSIGPCDGSTGQKWILQDLK